jgi:hypothetical protein
MPCTIASYSGRRKSRARFEDSESEAAVFLKVLLTELGVVARDHMARHPANRRNPWCLNALNDTERIGAM